MTYIPPVSSIGDTQKAWLDAELKERAEQWAIATYQNQAAEQFELGYAERSGITVEQLREHSKVVPCDCGDPICEGWGMDSLADGVCCGECGHYNFWHTEDGACRSCGCDELTSERRWPRSAAKGRRFESGPGASRVVQQVEQGSRNQPIAGDGGLARSVIPLLPTHRSVDPPAPHPTKEQR